MERSHPNGLCLCCQVSVHDLFSPQLPAVVFAYGRIRGAGENVSSWVGGMITFIALAHMLDDTQLVWGGRG